MRRVLIGLLIAGTLVGTVAASPLGTTFGPGKRIVGVDMEPGTYRSTGDGLCAWNRLASFDGSGNIIASGFGTGRQVVTIAESDVGFDSGGCGEWSDELAPITTPTGPVPGNGTYIVGVDMEPGLWRSEAGLLCAYSRLRSFTGKDDVISTDVASSSAVVTIKPDDAGFRTGGCGDWTKVK